MRFKKLTSIILVALLLFTFTACSEKEDNSTENSVTTSTSSKKETKNSSKKETKKKSKKNKASEEDTKEKKKSSSKIDSGSWDDNTYTNDFLGISITVPEDWYIASEKQLNEAVGISKESIADGDEDKEDYIDSTNSKTAYLFLITKNRLNKSSTGNANMMVMAKKLDSLSKGKDCKEYAESLQEGMQQFNPKYDYTQPITT